MSDTFDLSKPMSLRAEMARNGLHDLRSYDDPERGWVNPLNDPEQQAAVRAFCNKLWAACLAAESEPEGDAVTSSSRTGAGD